MDIPEINMSNTLGLFAILTKYSS